MNRHQKRKREINRIVKKVDKLMPALFEIIESSIKLKEQEPDRKDR